MGQQGNAVLVTGGAGYIGAHAVLALQAVGFSPVVLDDLSAGCRHSVPGAVPFYRGSVGDAELVARILTDHNVVAVLHFAGSIIVSESVKNPLLYYRNNTVNSQILIETCVSAGIKAFIFSSTAAVYGANGAALIDEDTPLGPLNPYGKSKWMTECMVRDVAEAHSLRYGILRYFNVAGADPQGRTGQSGRVATHLIKIAAQTVTGKRAGMEIYGDDYPTIDGTCIRDYVHVSDLAEAHVLALQHLLRGGDNLVVNCGYGRGFSVREVLAAVETVAQAQLNVKVSPRRPGDAPSLVAANARIRQILGWQPQFDDLDVIVRSALAWEKRLIDS